MLKTARDKKIPPSLKNIEQWQMSRKNFVKGLFFAGVLTQIPFISSCLNNKLDAKSFENNANQFNEVQLLILKDIQEILFPNDGNGPSAKEINAHQYLQWIVLDSRMDPDEVNYIFNGIKWTNETANEKFNSDFLDLSNKEKNKLVEIISKTNWGENWLSVILTFIFEALLCDPQYGGNPDSVGWKWLNHYPGNPRPTEDLLYENILNTVNIRNNG